MRGTVTEKILSEHLVEGELIPGQEIAIKIDDTLTQDATGTMAWLQFEATGAEKVKTKAVSVIDHNTVQMGFENADDHDYLQSAAKKYGAILSRAGNGICHQVFLEQFSEPGKTLVGSDSHTPTAGGIGQIAIGVGGLDVALAMAGKPYRLKVPNVIGIKLKGKLKDWATAKDIILKLLSEFGTKNKGSVFEYFGDGVTTLSVPERATITNMGAETGATTSIFPSDENTRDFLNLVNREKGYNPISADEDAEYSKVFEIDLSLLEPMVVLPPKPGVKGLGLAVPLKEAIGVKVNQVTIGACTNSSYHDMMIVAHALDKKDISKDVELVITPGSRAVKQLIIDDGGYSSLNKAGARFTEEVCGACIGQGYSPRSKGVRVSTHNRNFCGRSGTSDAEVFIVSPETAAASALTGEISDPRVVFKDKDYQRFSPKGYPKIDSLLIPNEGDSDSRIIRGPNIGEAPKNAPLQDSIEGVVTIKLGDSITTDDITPAGSWLKYRSNVRKYSEAVFSGIDPEFFKKALQNKEKKAANVIVAGSGYGEGSSREHAAICPMYLGVKIVLAKGFQRIHSDNLANFGIIPLIFSNEDDYDLIGEGDNLRINTLHEGLSNNNIRILNESRDKEIKAVHELSERQIDMILKGGALNNL